ncbi:MAG TPA: hypothetical protein VFQ70_02215 [Candidatus Saccharimonadaceae bacterium]|nr:hypothetical protein [Candidatus Saccharimonadaceae bacterium]
MPPNNQTNTIPPQQLPPTPGQPGVTGTPSSHPKEDAPKKPSAPNSTQNSLLISEIRDGMVIMSDGSFRAVVACQSINFDLMSAREREGVEFSYQNFLNALYFPVQIFIRSERVDIGPYLDRLENIRNAQDNMLLGVLMDDYIEFVDALSQEANIMDKRFYIVVPYFPQGSLDVANVKGQAKGFFGKLFSQPKAGITHIDSTMYQKAKDEIKNRIDSVTSGLYQIGVKCAQLNTKELGELYYNVYNPDTAVREPLGDFRNITTTFVQKGEGEAARPHIGDGVNGGIDG